MFFKTKLKQPDKLNICIVAKEFPILGRAVEHGFLWPIARGLALKGHSVTVLSWKSPQAKTEIIKDDVHAYFIGQNTFKRIEEFPELALGKLKQLHAEKPFHIVHSIDDSGIPIAKLKKDLNLAMAFDVDATKMSSLFAIAGMSQDTVFSIIRTAFSMMTKFLVTFYGGDRSIIKQADGIFVTNPQQRIILERYYLYPELKTFIVPYGIEIGDLSPKERSEELRKFIGFPANAKVAVTISDMNELEEMKHLFRAFELVAIKKTAARLVVIGDGPLKEKIEYEALQLALGSKVKFIGSVSNTEISDYISLADIFINLSSRTSGFEPNLLEAMAQKKVIIGSEVSPISNIVDHGGDGFLLRPADRQALSKLLLKIFSEEVDSETMGEKAREKVINLFDIKKMVNETVLAYKQTMVQSGLYK